MSFDAVINANRWEDVSNSIYEKDARDVERALSSPRRDLEDFKALISPAAAPYLEEMVQMSSALTKKRFGNTVQMYIPLYLSNECNNICTYCGFSLNNPIKRKTLSDEEILKEVAVIKAMKFDHVLIVTGESSDKVGLDYIKNAINIIKSHFSNVSMEVQPMDQNEYEELKELGLNSVYVYQETYRSETYKEHHPKGRKSNFEYRIETPERLGNAKIHRIGLGVLLGLEDWRVDSFFTAAHLSYLEKKFWQTKYSISFPRLRPCSGVDNLKSNLSDKELAQLISAFRIFNGEVELSLSTREEESFRNNSMKLGITSISAGSKTSPGGYSNETEELEQFEISDERSPARFASELIAKGYEPVWKDWDRGLV
ncbi:MAG: 2-iminoacetate synthase ThiH [Flavobacteriales bacterium]|nr:2-iminoacetate synthase ThiH [Flavobacteriales bacterium]